MRKPTNQEIAQGIINLNIKTFRYLDKNLKPKTIAHIKSNSGTKEDGEEIYNDVLRKIFYIIEGNKYDPNRGCTFFNYFLRLVNNTWIDRIRKKQSEKNINIIELSDKIKNTYKEVNTPKDGLNFTHFKILDKYLNQLKKEDFQIMELYYFEKLSIKKIIPKLKNKRRYKFIKLRLVRIREKLEKWLNDDPDFNFEIP